MKKSDLLKQQRTAVLRKQQTIVDKAKTENRDFTADEQTELDSGDEEIADLDKQIKTAEKNEEREARIAALDGSSVGRGFHGAPMGNSEEKEIKKIQERFSISKAIRAASAGEAQTGIEAELNQEALKEARGLNLQFNTTDRSFSIPASMVRATTQTVTEDNGDFGSQLVQTNVRPIESFIPRLILEEAGATFLSGLSGNVALPKAGDFAYNWLNETEQITLAASEIDGPILKPKRAGAGVAISNQLLMQSSAPVDAMIYNKLRNAAKLALEKAAINGDGVKQPLGLLNTPGILTAAATVGAAPEWKDIVELWGLIEAADAGVGTFALNAKLAAALRTIAKDAGSGRFLMENLTIDGAKTIISNIIETLAGNETLIYGNFNEMYIGQWGGVNFVAVDDPEKASVKIISNMWADVAIANPTAFAVNKFLTT
ncbi:phage major capsid protein [Myroides sp. JBRI-B21084]|uniref:phage major capsid protein n=1 Tax=Myroides sp. JBRI-B21084 TaxID=3119977 RepID=UPI0026E1C755|nr:phage major capsid protein [Paenimyroides cloacae]WKW47267.1 phage major capsid protein [Paenimyroides cloacae]